MSAAPPKPRRQEQEPARTEVTEVARDVLRMELPIRMPGLGHVNCYALIDDEGAAVVDPGMPGRDSWRALTERLKQAGLAPRHVHTVIVTHSHPDHFGGANRFAKESGAKVVAHVGFRFGVEAQKPEVSVDDLAAQDRSEAAARAEEAREDEERTHKWEAGRTPWGGRPPRPPLRSRVRWTLMRAIGRIGWVPTITGPVKSGEVLRLAKREWTVMHTPGHTEDHICLHDRAEGVFLAGDHVLPTITPHISGLVVNRDPLQAFFDSLDLAAATPDVEQVLPAHGHPFRDLAGRCKAIKQHHDERLAKVRAISRALGAPARVEAFSHELFKRRSWGPMADSETYAHLEHLRLLGLAERSTDREGNYLYLTA